jgi:hypothetical protein
MSSGVTPDLISHLAHELAEARRTADRSALDVAFHAGLDPATIYDLERRPRWPRNPDRVVAAYARATGVASIDLWIGALGRFRAGERLPAPVNGRRVGYSVRDLAEAIVAVQREMG